VIARVEALVLCPISQLLAARKALIERLSVAGGGRRIAKSGITLDV
jgi:hypothetical protein